MTSTMTLADHYADAETAFWFGQEQSNARVDTDARLRRDEVRAALEQRIKELEADAKRYRWLTGAHTNTEATDPEIGHKEIKLQDRIIGELSSFYWDKAYADHLIDRAMSEVKV